MFRPPFLARVAAGAAVYALEETRRLPTAAMNFPVTAISQLLQTSMHVQQFVTSLALKGDAVFERLGGAPAEQPEWATFDEDLPEEDPTPAARISRFDRYTVAEPPAANGNGHGAPTDTAAPIEETPSAAAEVVEPEVATRYDYPKMTLAQLRARLRMLTVEELDALLDYEQRTSARAPFITMLTNRIATVRAQ
ncbi:lipid droplet-associated protein [Nocardia panacis]|uniref:Lipid droplet-associated protein n=1 Tax=Nocardia panacis TaxID=2340916 RepID=A0A3A4KL49_9NOCA|nr:lipid droplet-associated protein [Nocardia panacis]RJO75890.1 lipid droplet-associated protein [Nocardia panacis]